MKVFKRCLGFILVFFFFQIHFLKAQNDIAKTADSLFLNKKYEESSQLYEAIFNDSKVNNAAIALKLAFINEKNGNYPRALFYLNSYYNLNPEDEVFEKMNKIALMNKYTGYERSNINFIFALYQQYYIFIMYALLSFGVFLIVILYNKKKHAKPIYKKNWILVLSYLILLAVLINLPGNYTSAIVKENTFLRDYPSSAAAVIGEISPGHKINIFGSVDIWQKAYWNQRVVYINKHDLWLLKD